MASDSHNIEEGIYSCDQKPFEAVLSGGLVIRKFSHWNHAGVLYQDQATSTGNSQQRIKMLHLAYIQENGALQCNSPTSEYLWVQPNIPTLILVQLAALCRRIWTRVEAYGNDYGYGFSAPYCTLQLNGLPRPSATGLTCATFALAVFSLCGIRLVQVDSWPKNEENLAWQTEFVLEHLRLNSTPEFLKKVKSEATGVRFTPEEVIGAALSYSGKPVHFNEAKRLAEIVETRLITHINKSNNA